MLPPFQLHRPATVGEASGLQRALGDAAFYAGGTELLQVMKLGFARFEHLIDLKGVDELHHLTLEPDGALRIGAAVTHRQIERSAIVSEHLPALAELARRVANLRVRTMGTLGGNLCFAEPHSDPAPFLVALGASLELQGSSGRRTVPVGAFLKGALTTDRADDEVLVAVIVPALPGASLVGYRKVVLVERPTAAAAVRLDLDANGSVAGATIVLGSVADVPMPLPEAAAALRGASMEHIGEAAAEAGAVATRLADADDDAITSAEYRRHLAGVVVRRATLAAAARFGASGSQKAGPRAH